MRTGLYVCLIEGAGFQSKQTFVTRYSPNTFELMDDVNVQLAEFNEIYRTDFTLVKVTHYEHLETQYRWPFKEYGTWNHIEFIIECYGAKGLEYFADQEPELTLFNNDL